jgi:hypothetical protein
MRTSQRRAGASLLLALSTLLAGTASAEELLVMPYACSMAGGRPILTPAREQSHRIVGPREQRPYSACSPVNPSMCRNWVVHRFDLDCSGARVPWVSVVASFAEDASRRAWLDGGRLVMRMPPSWSSEPDDPCARPPGPMDQLGFGRMRRYCADRRAMAPPVVEMPFGFAPMLGIDGIFVKANGPIASGPPPIIAGAGPHGDVDRPDPWPPSRHVDEPRGFSEPRATAEAGPPPSRHMDEPRGFLSSPRPMAEAGPPSRHPAPPVTSTPSRDPHPAERAAPVPAPAPKIAAAPPPKPATPTPPPPAVSSPQPAPPAAPAPVRQAAAPSAGADQPIVPKIINRPEHNAAPQAPQEKDRHAEAALAPTQQSDAPAEQPAPSAAAASKEPESIRINLLSAVQTPTIGIISFGVLALVLLAAFAIARRRDRLVGAPQVRDIGSVSLGGGAGPAAPRLPVPRRAMAQPPAPVPPPAPAPGNAWMNRVPQTRAEAMQILGMGVSPDTTEAAVKRLVDGLRMSWHPDLAKDEADRQLREFRVKQINAAWDLIRSKSMERLDS